jgi:serine/threonine-protein kinase
MRSESASLMRPHLAPGTRLNGIYEIDHPIGIGGMGEIYKGHLIETGDPVAIKMMLPEFSENEVAFTLFRKEASALHYVQHNAVVRYYVFTVEPVLRRPYLAMEFVEGRTLTDVIASNGPMPFEAAQSLLHRVASGLQAVHEHGIVHRDVSPDNILIPQGDVTRAKIIDFGIARTAQHGTVIAGGFAGKFSYVSPEQLGLFGGEVTAKSDIYSLGLVIAQTLTGQPLDMGGTQFEVIEKRRKLPELGAIDMRFRPLLEQMLQPDPSCRPESMAAVIAWPLGPAVAGLSAPQASVTHGAATKPAKNSSWFKYAAIAGAIAVLVGIGGSAVYFYGFQSPGSRVVAAPNADKSGITSTGGQLVAQPAAVPGALSPDGGGGLVKVPAAGGALLKSSTDKIRAYIEQYDGGNCFFVTPVAISEHVATIEGFGSSVEPFRVFDSAFSRQLGFEPNIGVRQVTDLQCPAVKFLAGLRGQNVPAPHLDIDRATIHNGEVLSGMVDHYSGQQIALILVSDSGTVQNVTSLLKPGTDAKTFKIGMRRSGVSAGRQPQLMIAIASRSFLNTLQKTETARADQFFASLLSETTTSDPSLSAAARYIMLER